jgi:hypothetical protein
MNSLFSYLFELNLSLAILYAAYKLFFERDKNFIVRRIYLMGVIILPFILPLIPESGRISLNGITPVSINLDEITVFGTVSAESMSGVISVGTVMIIVYLSILSLGVFKLFIQLAGIIKAIVKSERTESNGITLLSNPSLHASSFFGYIFMNPDSIKNDSFNHILEHENIHKREWHSIDRIMAELFVLINWFNPVAWLFRKSVIENLEFLADSAVLRNGTDPTKYQLSILNQYIGSASISNQFSSQIKKRINMLNKNYKLGSTWKLTLVFPLVFAAFLIVSCTEKDASLLAEDASAMKSASTESQIYTNVDVMPTFQGEDPKAFRKFIAQNVIYPEEAKENGVTGKIIIKFVVRKDGKVEIPDVNELPPSLDGKEMGEVAVVGYRSLDADAPVPDEKFIELLKQEAIRVISSSPDWEPGKVDGKPVKVMFTFPINFALQ